MRKLGVFVLAAAVSVVSAVAFAQSPDAVVKERKAAMKGQGAAVKVIVTYLKGQGGTAAEVQKAATALKADAAKLPDLFPAGTGIGVDDSVAKPEIWQNKADFAQKIAGFQSAAAKLVQVAATDDRGALQAAMGAVGKACGACHETYRAKR